MKNKTILITGSSSGIGLATAEALAAKGAELILAARSEEKLKEAIKHISAKTGNNNLKYYVADFSSMKSVRNLAVQVKKDYTKIDVLLNNAGGVFPEFKLTEDGLEYTIATNHFAYFLLTNLLLDLVKKSDYARIVNVASGSHYKGVLNFESFTKDVGGYFIMKAYAQSKLANVLFTYELAERLKGTHVTANCLHPGMVKTDIGGKSGNWYSKPAWYLATMFGISVEDGAKTSVYLASSDEVKGVSGKYFDKCKAVEPNKDAYNAELRKQLWQVTEKLCPVNV